MLRPVPIIRWPKRFWTKPRKEGLYLQTDGEIQVFRRLPGVKAQVNGKIILAGKERLLKDSGVDISAGS